MECPNCSAHINERYIKFEVFGVGIGKVSAYCTSCCTVVSKELSQQEIEELLRDFFKESPSNN